MGTVELGGGPEFAAADGNGYVFNNLEDQSQVLKINSRTLQVRTAMADGSAFLSEQHGDRSRESSIFSGLPQQGDGCHGC